MAEIQRKYLWFSLQETGTQHKLNPPQLALKVFCVSYGLRGTQTCCSCADNLPQTQQYFISSPDCDH